MAAARKPLLPAQDWAGIGERLDVIIDQNDELLTALIGRREPPTPASAPPGTVRVKEPGGIKRGKRRRA